jgi:hypothetical protein
MKVASEALLNDSKVVEKKLYHLVVQYQNMKDVRWMFAYAHYRITQQINRAVVKPVFRDPDQLLTFQRLVGNRVPGRRCRPGELSVEGRRLPTVP